MPLNQASRNDDQLATAPAEPGFDPGVNIPPDIGRPPPHRNGVHLIVAALRGSLSLDALTLQRAGLASVYARWLVWLAIVILMAYRPALWYPDDWPLLLLHAPLLIGNGLAHRRLYSAGGLSSSWLLALSGLDIALITTGIVIGGEFHRYFYIGYYPALALFAAIFTSVRFNLTWTALAAAAYAGASLFSNARLDLDSGEESALVARIAVMFVIVGCITLAIRFERRTRQAALERERALQRERIESTQAIHDSGAQTALLIGFSIERAIALADSMAERPSRELRDALAAAHALSRRAIWELRRPFGAGGLYEGQCLGSVLRSHTDTFRQLSALDVRWSQSGVEQPLPISTSSRLFAIAHNALTNVLLHANASRVEVALTHSPEAIRLVVSDDGIGLPADYDERGNGFTGMRRDAEQAGGRLIVQSETPSGGTTVICEAPRSDRVGRQVTSAPAALEEGGRE